MPSCVLQAHQQGLVQEAAGRRHRQEVRLVDHDQVLVLEQHLLLERNRRFVIEFAVVPDARAGAHDAVGRQRRAGAVDHLAARHAVAPGGLARLRENARPGRPACRPSCPAAATGSSAPRRAGSAAERRRWPRLAVPLLSSAARCCGTPAACATLVPLAARIQRQQHVHVAVDLGDAVGAARVGRQQRDRRALVQRAHFLPQRDAGARIEAGARGQVEADQVGLALLVARELQHHQLAGLLASGIGDARIDAEPGRQRRRRRGG